jgi:hypothetical protein
LGEDLFSVAIKSDAGFNLHEHKGGKLEGVAETESCKELMD